jgi:general secretion pathway protein A
VQPPTSPSENDEPLYEAFYGLREQPFALSTDPKFIFWSGSHRRAYDDLLVGLRRREGLLLLTGETGTGKTTLCRAVIDALGHRTFSALVLNPYMAGPEVLRVILRDFGLVSREEIRRGSLSRADAPHLLDTLEGFLRSLVPLDARAVVIVDEAQSLSPEALDQVRMLGAYEENGQRLLQIVLCGQPGLLNTLKTDPLRALNERITRRAGLNPLLAPEVEAYVRHRLSVAGAETPTVFAPEALGLVAEYSRGLPRRINVLCDRALDEGRRANSHAISAEIVKRAAKSLASPSTSVPVIHAADVVAATPGGADRARTAAPAPRPAPTRLVAAPAPPSPSAAPVAPAPSAPLVEEPPQQLFHNLGYEGPAVEEDAMVPASPSVSPVALGAGGAILVVVLAVGAYVWSVASGPVALPPVAPAPLSVGAPAPTLAVPTDDQIKDMLEGRVPNSSGSGSTATRR